MISYSPNRMPEGTSKISGHDRKGKMIKDKMLFCIRRDQKTYISNKNSSEMVSGQVGTEGGL